MDDKLTQEQIKAMLVGKKITDVNWSPYLSLKLDDSTEIEIIPEQIEIDEFIYLNLSFKQK